MKKLSSLIIIVFFVLFLGLIASCSNNRGYIYIEGKINIVATTTILGDLAKEIGGDCVSVTILMGIGVDPHNYQPKPSDSTALNKADLVLVNGLYLEAKMGEVFKRLSTKVLVVGSYLESEKLIKNAKGTVDPHIWFDVSLWKQVAQILGDKLQKVNLPNKEVYAINTQSYINQLDETERYVLQKVDELPAEKRILVTAHDAFRYFAKAYGFEVHSIQGISTETEASAKDIQDLANLVVKLKVKAIFVESSIPKSTIQSVVNATKVQNHSVTVGGELFSDSLGDASSSSETYIKTVRKNVDTIVDALK